MDTKAAIVNAFQYVKNIYITVDRKLLLQILGLRLASIH